MIFKVLLFIIDSIITLIHCLNSGLVFPWPTSIFIHKNLTFITIVLTFDRLQKELNSLKIMKKNSLPQFHFWVFSNHLWSVCCYRVSWQTITLLLLLFQVAGTGIEPLTPDYKYLYTMRDSLTTSFMDGPLALKVDTTLHAYSACR